MGLLDVFRRTRPLTAAATVATSRQLEASGGSTQTRDVTEAWRVWRATGEIHYVTTQQARLVSRLHWDVRVNGADLDPEAADELLAAAFGADLPELARQAALHLEVAGAYLLARIDDEWEVLPYPVGYAEQQKLKRADVTTLVSNPDPVDPRRFDSPVLAALDVARELLLARAQARAAARSRTAQLQTIIYPLEGVPDPEAFEAELMDVMTAPLEDERSSATVVPNMIGFPGERIDQWKTLDLTGPLDEKLHDKIAGLIRQLAVIMDAPPEILTGMGETNHWTSWAIQEDNWLGHVEPMAQMIGRGFAVAIAQATGTPVEAIDVLPDPAPLLKRRPTITDALAAYTANLVSADWARAQLGADVDDAPDQGTDPAVQVALDMLRAAPSLAQDPGLPTLVEQVRAATSGGSVPVVEADEIVVTEEVGAEPAQPQIAAGRPGAAVPFSTDRLLSIDQAASDALSDLLALALFRVREKVGSQIRSRLQGDPETKAAMADIDNADLPERLPKALALLPNLDQTVADTLASVIPAAFGRIVRRAYADTRAAGIRIELDPQLLDETTEILLTDGATIALDALNGEAVEGALWVLNRQALTIAGGGLDPAVEVGETAAARKRIAMPSPLDGAGIALGRGAIGWVVANLNVSPRAYLWEHVGGSGNDHPEHVMFNGWEYDGDVLEYDGIRWFIGDHLGCRCRRVPLWEENR